MPDPAPAAPPGDRGIGRRRGVGLSVGLRLAAALATAGLLAGCASPPATSGGPETPYRIGVIASKTGAGSLYGLQQIDATAFAADQANAAGGVDGHPIELVVRDDESDPTVGREAMRELIEDEGVVAVIGPTLSLVAREADPLADQLLTPVLAVSNTVDGIVGACSYSCRWVWRDSLGERVAVQANVAAYARDAAPRTAATVQTVDDVLGTAGVTYAVQAFKDAGIDLVGQAELQRNETMTDRLAAVLARKPDVLFLGSTYGDWAASVMKAARELGYEGQFLGGNILNSETTRELAGAAGIGTRSGAAWVATNRFPANEQFIDDYRHVVGRAPDQFDAQAYVGVQILVDALERADPAALRLAEQRAAVQAALSSVAIDTVLGPFRFTPQHDVDQIVWVLQMAADGHELVAYCDPYCDGGSPESDASGPG